GGLLTVFLICFFWVLGIHGPAIMRPVIGPFWDMSIAENLEGFTNGANVHQLPNIFTEQYLQWFYWIGEAGTTLSSVV
ncbi:PTS transporter subunit EIIC, partial [Enterococcus faecalis]|uniref:PTS transporter subunit EIIC n=1 Tax=Enterococcus faecalis TaxID=1351 RepID=UPI003D6B7DC1